MNSRLLQFTFPKKKMSPFSSKVPVGRVSHHQRSRRMEDSGSPCPTSTASMASDMAGGQGLTLVHFSAQRKHIL